MSYGKPEVHIMIKWNNGMPNIHMIYFYSLVPAALKQSISAVSERLALQRNEEVHWEVLFVFLLFVSMRIWKAFPVAHGKISQNWLYLQLDRKAQEII